MTCFFELERVWPQQQAGRSRHGFKASARAASEFATSSGVLSWMALVSLGLGRASA
jgi:hypothetical protein